MSIAQSFNFIFKIKDNVEKTGVASSETVTNLLSLYASELLYNEKLYKELNHALLTGGEYLDVKPILH